MRLSGSKEHTISLRFEKDGCNSIMATSLRHTGLTLTLLELASFSSTTYQTSDHSRCSSTTCLAHNSSSEDFKARHVNPTCICSFIISLVRKSAGITHNTYPFPMLEIQDTSRRSNTLLVIVSSLGINTRVSVKEDSKGGVSMEKFWQLLHYHEICLW